MKSAFLFPGQGAQYVGMGKDLYQTYPAAKKVFDLADEILDIKLSKICFEGPEEHLKQTRITQPALFVHSMAVCEILKESEIEPYAAAGHSLGEYTALVAARAFSFHDGLNLVRIRGELMQKAGEHKPGTMAAIIGLGIDQVMDACQSVKNIGVVVPANFNSPGQIVISGDVPAVHAAMEILHDVGAKKVIELVVSGAFHSPLMESAQQGLLEALEKTEINNAVIPVYTNVEAMPTTASNKIRDLLYKQLTKPVRWTDIIQNMVSYGLQNFLEVGSGKVLCGLTRRIDRNVNCRAIGTVNDIEALTTS